MQKLSPLLRANLLPEAGKADPSSRQLRELVRLRWIRVEAATGAARYSPAVQQPDQLWRNVGTATWPASCGALSGHYGLLCPEHE